MVGYGIDSLEEFVLGGNWRFIWLYERKDGLETIRYACFIFLILRFSMGQKWNRECKEDDNQPVLNILPRTWLQQSQEEKDIDVVLYKIPSGLKEFKLLA